MSTKYKVYNTTLPHFITFTVVEWIDVFTRAEYKDVLLESLYYCQQHRGLKLFAFCIMSNHVHLIAAAENGLPNVVRDCKKYTSNQLITAIEQNPQESRKNWMLWIFKQKGKQSNQDYQFWQQGYYPIELHDKYMMEQKLEYVHHNPVKAGICYKPEDYIYSSAANYAGEKGILEVELMI